MRIRNLLLFLSVATLVAIVYVLVRLPQRSISMSKGLTSHEIEPAGPRSLLSNESGRAGQRDLQTMGSGGRMDVIGTVVLLNGEPVPSRGHMTVVTLSPTQHSDVLSVPIEQAAWGITVLTGTRLVVCNLELGEHRAWPLSSLLDVPPDGHVSIEASYKFTLGIPVVDVVSHAEIPLADIVAMPTAPVARAILVHPLSSITGASESPRQTRTPLPVAEIGIGAFLVSAPGYAWERLIISPQQASPPLVELHGAGGLSVRCSGSLHLPPETSMCLKLTAISEPVVADSIATYAFGIKGFDNLELTHLRPGRYRCSLEALIEAGSPIILGQADVQVDEGETAPVVIRIGSGVRVPQPTSVSGVVYPSEPAGIAGVTDVTFTPLELNGLGHQPQVELRLGDGHLQEEHGVLTWDSLPLIPGVYRVQCEPIGVVEVMRVPEEPLFLFELTIPPSKHMSVRIVDEQTREPVSIEAFYYRVGATKESLLHVPIVGYSPPAPRNPLEFDAPTGFMDLVIVMPGNDRRHFQLDTRDSQILTATIRETSRVHVRLIAMGEPLPFQETWWTGIRVESMQGANDAFLTLECGPQFVSRMSSEAIIALKEPGKYRVRFPWPTGYCRPIADVLVDAPPRAEGASLVDVDLSYLMIGR